MQDYMMLENSRIPLLGLGTWDMYRKDCTNSVAAALEMGYRHIDTARIYNNEAAVGAGIRQSSIPREECFITTKVATGDLKPSVLPRSVEDSLEKLQTEYIDLLLIHWPTLGLDLEATLEAMFRMKDQGKIRHAGVSNFSPVMFREAIGIGPVICNQVEFSPYVRQDENLAVALETGLLITAHTPLGKGRVSGDPLLTSIGSDYGRTAAQIALRWLLQQGNVSVIPKSSSEAHLRENMEVFDFELSGEDMARISAL